MSLSKSQSSFVFLRHGLSEGNKEGIIQGRTDYPLAQEGQQQIETLIDFWKAQNRSFDRIISSPLTRARSSADLLAAALKLEPEFDDLWEERHHGEAEGAPYDQANQWYADRPNASPFEPVFDSGESEWELHIRACKAIHKLILLDPGSYLIVSHGGFLGAVLRAVLGIAPSSGRTRPARISLANAGFADLRYDHLEARWYIDTLNSTAHL